MTKRPPFAAQWIKRTTAWAIESEPRPDCAIAGTTITRNRPPFVPVFGTQAPGYLAKSTIGGTLVSGGTLGRVTQGGCPPRVPTDPDLPN